MTSVLILLSGFDPGTYYIEDNGNPSDGIAQLRGPDGSVIPFNIPTEFLTVTASAGRSVVINLPEWDPAADINVGNLTNSAENPDSITVASIRGAADVTLVSNGAITELGSDAAADIIANTLILSAATGVGSGGNAIETRVGTLEAETTTGGINLGNTGDLTIGGLTDEVVGLDVETSGDIVITNLGSIVLNEESPGGLESVHGGATSGNVTLIANGANSDITSSVDQDAIAANGGSITLTAGRDVSMGTAGLNFDNDVRARDHLTINAGRDLNIDGFADFASDGFGAATGGNVVVNAARDINVLNSTGTDGSIGAEGSAGGNATLNAGPGGFVRLLATSTSTLFSSSGNVTVNSDRVIINASSGITAGSGVVTLRPATEGWAIDLGSATDGAFALELSDAEADRIFTTNLTIGSTASGPLTASGAFGPSGVQNLQLISGTEIRLTSAMTVANALTLRAGDDVHLLSGSATTVAALNIFVDQAGDDGNLGGLVTFGGALTTGATTITGDVDADPLTGTSGNDTINGGAGNDTIDGGAGVDTINGGIGNDTLFGGGDDTGEFVHGNSGNDTITSTGEGSYFGDDDDDTIFAGLGAGLIDEILNGGDGIDTLDTTSFSGDYAINLATGVTNLSFESFVNFENLNTGGGIDTLVGTSGANTIRSGDNIDTISGGGGGDMLVGEGGPDTLNGNGGNDTLLGGTGGDKLFGGFGKDTMTGNAANDQFVFLDGETAATRVGADIITDFTQAHGDLIKLKAMDADTTLAGDQKFKFIGAGAFTGAARELHYVHDGGNTFIEGDTDGDGAADFVIRLNGLINLTVADFWL